MVVDFLQRKRKAVKWSAVLRDPDPLTFAQLDATVFEVPSTSIEP